MDFRKKVALILCAVILYETAGSRCMPQSLSDNPFEKYINKQKYSPSIPNTHARKTHRFQDDLRKQNKLYSKISPIEASDSLINNLKREKRMKRKQQRAQKIYTRDNDETLTVPVSFHNQGPPFYLSEVGSFPEVQYPLTASDTWCPNYWNSLPSHNYDRFYKNDACFTLNPKPNTVNFNIFKQTPSAKNNKKLSGVVKKSDEFLERERTKTNKIARQTTASQGHKKNIDCYDPKDENEIEKYIMHTPKSKEKKNTSTATNENICQSKKKINAGSKINNKTVSQDKISKVTERITPSKDDIPDNLKAEKTFLPITKTENKSFSKKSMSSIKEATSHFSKLKTKLEHLNNKHQKTSSKTNANQAICFSPTNGTSIFPQLSTNQQQNEEAKISAQDNLMNILILNKQDTSLGNFDIVPCTCASDSSSEIIFENNTYDDKSVDKQRSDYSSKDDPQISDRLITTSQAEDLSEIMRLLTVWNSHIDISGENVHQTSEVDKIDGFVPITPDILSEGPKMNEYASNQLISSNHSCESMCKLNATDHLRDDLADYSCKDENKYNEIAQNSNENMTDHTGGDPHVADHSNEDSANSCNDILREDILKHNVNEGVIYCSIDDICTVNRADHTNEDQTENLCENVQKPNVNSCEGEVNSSCEDEDIQKPNTTEYSCKGDSDCLCEDKFNIADYSKEAVNNYSCKRIRELNATCYSSEIVRNYSCDNTNTYKSSNENVSETCYNISNPKVTEYSNEDKKEQSNEILSAFSNEDIEISDVIKRKVKNMTKFDLLEHETEQKLDNIPTTASEDSGKRIPESSEIRYLNEDFEIVSDSPTIYHIPFEKLTLHSNDELSTIPIDVDDGNVNDEVIEDFTLTNHNALSDSTPLGVSPYLTYEVNEEIPDTELVTLEKYDKTTSTETKTDKDIITNDNFRNDYLPVFTFDNVSEPLSDDSEAPVAFDSTYLPSFDENILKLHNETETEIFENYLPSIANRDKKAYEEVCSLTENEPSENLCFINDDYLNNTQNYTNDRKEAKENNTTGLFGDKENPDFYDFMLYPEDYEYTGTSKNNDARDLNSDTNLDFADYTAIPDDSIGFSEYSEENYIESLATTISPFDQYDDSPEVNEESKGILNPNENINDYGNRYVSQYSLLEPQREIKSSADYTSQPEDSNPTKYFDDNIEKEHEFRPLYERNTKPLLHRDFVQHHQKLI